MNTEGYINKIIEETGLNRKEIKNLVEEKKNELKGLISEEGALFIIAKELGVNVKKENKELMKDIEINISDITPNMKNITLVGRINQINKVFSFNKKEGEIGKVGSFVLHDNSGNIRIVLWDEQTQILEHPEFQRNELVKILNGYARKGKMEETEVHIGRLGKILIAPEDIDYKRYPKIKEEYIPINEINLSLSSISIEGKIGQIFPIKEFTKKSGEIGKVCTLVIMDSTGSARVTFWNEETARIDELNVNDFISITNLNPKLSSYDSKSIDLYVTRNSEITKKDKKVEIEGQFVEHIKDLQKEQGLVSFQGIVNSIDNLKQISLKSGEDVNLLGFIISDESDWIRVTVWRDKAESLSKKIKMGKGLLLKNVLLKYSSFSNRNEISLVNDSKLEFIDLEIKNLKAIEIPKSDNRSKFTRNYTKINTINTTGTIEIKGFISKEIKSITIYEACTNCFKKIENCSCDNKNKTEHRMILNVVIDDGSGTIRTTFIGEVAEKFLGEQTDNLIKIRETPDFDKFLEKKSSEILGKDIIIKGRAKFSDFSNTYEVLAYDFKDLNINEELENVMKEIAT